MPRYRAQDFLAEAQRKTSVFLSCYLVAVPIHLETVDQYAHNGAFSDATFRQPWLFDDIVEAVTIPCDLVDDLDLLGDHCPKVPYPSVEEFNPDGEDVVFIPSSNPSSPIISTQECKKLQQRTLVDEGDQDGVEVSDISHDIAPKDRAVGYLLELPELSPLVGGDEYRCSIKQLCLHLKKKQVKDPFLGADGMPISQSLFSSIDQKPVFEAEEEKKREQQEDSFGIDLPTKEDFIGEQVDKDCLLELPVCHTPGVDPGEPTTEAISADKDMSLAPLEDEHDINKDFSDLTNTGSSTVIKAGCEELAIQPKPVIEDESRKWALKRKPDDTTLEYLTEVPAVITIGSTPPPRLPSPFDGPENVPLFDLDLEQNEDVVSQGTVTRISDRQWNDEKYFGTVSSWLVKEPSAASVTMESSGNIHRDLMNDLKLTSESTEDHTQEDIFSREFYGGITASMNSSESWRRCAEKFLSRQGEADGGSAVNASQINIDWGDVSVLTDLPLEDIHDAKLSSRKQVNVDNFRWESTPAKSISAKLAGMLKLSKASVGTKSVLEDLSGPPDDREEVVRDHVEKKQKIDKTDDKESILKAEDSSTFTDKLDSKKVFEPSRVNKTGFKKAEPKKAEKRKSAFNDPLNDFLFLSGMSGYRPRQGGNCQPGQFVSRRDGRTETENRSGCQDEKMQQELEATNIDKEEADEHTMEPSTAPPDEKAPDVLPEPLEPTIQKPERSRAKAKSKTKIISVKMPDYFKSALDVIEDWCSPILKQLQNGGGISPTYTTLMPDVIGALLKEEFESTKRRLKQDTDKVFHLVQLYVCLSTRDVALQGDLPSALEGLGVMIYKYSLIVQGSLDGLQQKLTQQAEEWKQNTLGHPKIAEMTRQVAFWLSRKILKAGDDQDLKVLVILKKESPRLAENIISSLNTIQGLKATSLDPALPASPNTTSRVLDSHNCLLVAAPQLDRDFLWAQFSLVVEYECSVDEPSVWQSLCICQNIRHLGFTMEYGDQGERGSLEEETDELQTPEKSLKLLCSSKVTEDSSLLHLLESKHNLAVLERSYENIRVCYADIIVDVVTGIVLMTAQEVVSTGIEGLTRRSNSLSQRFQKIWLVVRDDSEEKSDFQNKTFRKCICQLHSAMAQYSKKELHYQVKVLLGASVQEVAELIKEACREAEENMSSVWHRDDWLSRQCITVQPSKHETFLMKFPSINSFTAQVLLTFAPLGKLLTSSAEDLATLAPWVPIKFLKIFEKYTHCSFDVDNLMRDRTQEQRTDSRSCNSPVIKISGEELDDTEVGHVSNAALDSPASNVSQIRPFSAAGVQNLPQVAVAKSLPATRDPQRQSVTSVFEDANNHSSRREPVHFPEDGRYVPSALTSTDSRRDWQMRAGPPIIPRGGYTGQHHGKCPSTDTMDGFDRHGMRSEADGSHGDSLQSAQSSVYAGDVLNTGVSSGGVTLPHRDGSTDTMDGSDRHGLRSEVPDSHGDSLRSAQSSVYAEDVLNTGASSGGDTLPHRDLSVGEPRGDMLDCSMTAELDPRDTARNILQHGAGHPSADRRYLAGNSIQPGLHHQIESSRALWGRTALELFDSGQSGTSARDTDMGDLNMRQPAYQPGGDTTQYHSARVAGGGDLRMVGSVAPERTEQTRYGGGYHDTDGYGMSAGDSGRGIHPVRQLPSYRQHGAGDYMDRPLNGSGEWRGLEHVTSVGPRVSRDTGCEEGDDPFQRIKEDCLRRVHTGSSRRGNLPPPLVTRDREGQQRSVVRPFQQATQHAGQVRRQGLQGRRLVPDMGLFDEAGGKRHLQPAPPTGRAMQARIQGTGMPQIQHSSGFFESTTSNKQRRLAYQRDPMSSDGQTKLTFL